MNLIPNALSLIIVGLLASSACWALVLILKEIYYELRELFAKLTKKEDEAIKECRKFPDNKWFCEHVSIIGDGESNTVYYDEDDRGYIEADGTVTGIDKFGANHKCRLRKATIVPGEPREITNACGAPRSAMKQEISVALLKTT